MREVAELLRRAERVTAICHENPDGDTLGAAIAIAIAAERLGKQSEVVSGDPPPPFLSVLPRVEQVRSAPALEPDLAVIVDTGDLARTGRVAAEHGEWLSRATIAVVDHHVSNVGFGAANWIDPRAAATCEMVALLLPELGVEIDAEVATALLTGIVQDTHTFAHPNATPRTLRVAADLVEAGAPLSGLNRAVYADKPFSTLALWGRMLATIDQRCDGRIVHASMTADMLIAVGEHPSASEGFVDLLASTKAADVTVLFKQIEEGSTRVSVRTTERADAVAIASAFGGGGHARAAGCTVQAPIAMARELVLAECERELARADAGGR
ncbi:MAG TPA: DHH family phosphoesterase [Candidatus Limnocylindria bacterium]|nr:DHH family phosphoesterase [Candidatus Limnocylindria bacterium]